MARGLTIGLFMLFYAANCSHCSHAHFKMWLLKIYFQVTQEPCQEFTVIAHYAAPALSTRDDSKAECMLFEIMKPIVNRM